MHSNGERFFTFSIRKKILQKVNVQIIAVETLIKHLENKIQFSETRDNLGKDDHASITMSFLNKYFFDKQRTNKQPRLGIK